MVGCSQRPVQDADATGTSIQQSEVIKKESKDQNSDIIQILENDLKRVETELKVLLEQKMRETIKNPSMVEMIDDMYSKMINEKYTEINSLKTN